MGARSNFAAAIGNAEGYGIPGAVPTVNNNPGDLRNWGGLPTDAGGYAIFPSAQAGWDALESQLNLIRNSASSYYNVNMTFAQMGAVWANGDANWARNVAAYLGTSVNAMIGQFLSGASFSGNAAPQSIGPLQIPVAPGGTSQASTPQGAGIDWQDVLLLAGIGLGLYIITRELFA